MSETDDVPELDEAEQDLMRLLCVHTITKQTGYPGRAVAQALDEIADRGESVLRWTATDAWLVIAGHSIVHAERDWLAWAAHQGDPGLN